MSIPRICGSFFVAFLAVLVGGLGSLGAQPPDARPNIIFLFSDDHAARAISCYDDSLIQTPSIDRIALEGVRFDRCYVTNSICGPSRACILTGKYSHKTGYFRNDQDLDPALETFPEILQKSGYQTALIGKWHLGRKTLPRGFHHWSILDHQGYYYQPKMIDQNGKKQRFGYVTDVITGDALHWLRQSRTSQQPFMLMVQYKAPHRPWDPGPQHLHDFEDHVFPEPTTLFDDFSGRSSAARNAQMRIVDDLSVQGPDIKAWDNQEPNGARDWFYNKMSVEQHRNWLRAFAVRNRDYDASKLSGDALVRWKYQRLLRDYLACVRGMDKGIGQILDYLDQSGLAENTVVIYSSDQGFFLGEHGWFDKRFMYEPSLRTPLVVRWPRELEKGAVVDEIVSNVDFAPTMLSLAGIPPRADMQGASLLPFLKNDSPKAWRKSFYYHYYEGLEGGHGVAAHEGVTTGRKKLIHYYQTDEWEFFDLEQDPDEIHNLYQTPSRREELSALKVELSRLKQELGVP